MIHIAVMRFKGVELMVTLFHLNPADGHTRSMCKDRWSHRKLQREQMRLGLGLEPAWGSTGGQLPLDHISKTSDHGYTVEQAPKRPLKKHLNQIQPTQAGQMDLDDGVS